MAPTFSAELLNRIQREVIFSPLDRDAVAAIARRMIGRLQDYLASEGTSLILTEGAYALLVEKGESRTYGARHLERTISELLRQPISDLLAQGRVPSGGQITVEAEDGQLKFALRGIGQPLALAKQVSSRWGSESSRSYAAS